MQNDELYGHQKWYFDSIFGKKYVQENCYKKLEDFLNDAPQIFYLYITPKMVCLSSGNSYVSTKTTVEKKISNMRAYEIFGIKGMEEAVEKTVCPMPKSVYRKKIIDEI